MTNKEIRVVERRAIPNAPIVKNAQGKFSAPILYILEGNQAVVSTLRRRLKRDLVTEIKGLPDQPQGLSVTLREDGTVLYFTETFDLGYREKKQNG